MQIKSWQIALIGTIIQSGIVALFILTDFSNWGIGNIIGAIVVGLIYIMIGAIPTYFFKKTQKIGSILSLIFGIGSLFLLLLIEPRLVAIFGIQGIFLLVASIHYFWKKV